MVVRVMPLQTVTSSGMLMQVPSEWLPLQGWAGGDTTASAAQRSAAQVGWRARAPEAEDELGDHVHKRGVRSRRRVAAAAAAVGRAVAVGGRREPPRGVEKRVRQLKPAERVGLSGVAAATAAAASAERRADRRRREALHKLTEDAEPVRVCGGGGRGGAVVEEA